MDENDVVAGIDVTGREFVQRASFFGRTYNLVNESGETLLTAKRRLPYVSPVEEKYLYEDGTGAARYRIVGDRSSNWSRTYAVRSQPDDIQVAQFDRVDLDDPYRWVLTTDEGPQATIDRVRGDGLLDPAGWDLPVLSPMSMTISSPDGDVVGSVDGRAFATRMTFDIELSTLTGIPKLALLLSIPVLNDSMRPQFEYWGGRDRTPDS